MLSEEIEKIVKKEKNIIPFLKKLSPTDKRELVPFLKKLHKKVFDFSYTEEKTLLGGISYTTNYKYTEKQRALVQKACYVCFNKTDVKKILFNVSNLSVSDDYLENIIPWYTPKWFSSVINEDVPWMLEYSKAMKLNEKGLLELTDSLIRNILPRAIIEYEWDEKIGRQLSFYKPDQLLKYPITLKEHIWLLFEEESTINNYYDYNNIENYKDRNDVWNDTIVNFVVNGELERKKTLVNTIYTSTKGFNKNLSGWFFDLLVKLDPSPEEVINLQDQFFSALNSPHSKVINTVLKYFKKVVNDKKFRYKIFIDNCSVLLNFETKTVVNSALMILDKIAKIHPRIVSDICLKASESLMNTDEKIQLRAAKIISKFGDTKNEELLSEISMYTDSLFFSSKEILQDYLLIDEDIFEDEEQIEQELILQENTKLPTYKSFDDLVFFLSQAIDNNNVYDIDLLINYLPKLNRLINENNVEKLESIFKRCIDLSLSIEGSSRVGQLEIESACFINDFFEIVNEKFSSKFKNFKKLKSKKISNLIEHSYYKTHYKNISKPIEKQTVPDHVYRIHRSLFIKSKELINKGLILDLLSTPTHEPCWVAPQILVDRILLYEKSNEKIDLYDFQIAIGRIPMGNYIGNEIDVLKESIHKIQDIELKNVLLYHFGEVTMQNEKVVKPHIWIQSVLSRNIGEEINYFESLTSKSLVKVKGELDWNCKQREHSYKDYDYSKRKYVQKKIMKTELRFEKLIKEKSNSDSIINSIKTILKKKKADYESIYDNIHFKKQEYYITIDANDDVKFLYLTPNNPGLFLSEIIRCNLNESTFYSETAKKNMVNILKGLYEIWNRSNLGNSTYLFMGTAFLCSHRVARELAGEIWVKTNSMEVIDNYKLGQIIGKLESSEYAPLKRFTDLLVATIFNASKNHNKKLFILLDAMIGNMNDKPIRGLKKLLEIFLELKRNYPELSLSKLTKQKINVWKDTNSLKKLITNLGNS